MSIRIVFIALVAACLVGSLRAAAPQLPTNWQTDCSSEHMKEATSEDLSFESCCNTLAKYYGPDSQLPSSNCWCVPEYFAQQAALAVKHYVSLPSYFGGCQTTFNISIYYYQNGVGPCAGMTAEESAAALAAAAGASTDDAAPVPAPLPMRSFSGWVHGLKEYKWGAVSFTVGLLSVIGFSLMAWAFVFDACVDVYHAISAKKTA
ncbi:hypothetical protein QBZ16_001452 [Prototheca wickerhamii]|uniref:Extracellular membrane protein CFEM domain-containing protein n=1 Tax=Prototheca wickerhamii TaxID=3111 RepID=A0AAD9IDJ2_PROWI|nr:hypothetical protein QBZ16_001452 [Prototheca wickerhamii]